MGSMLGPTASALAAALVLIQTGRPPHYETARFGPECVDHRTAVHLSDSTSAAFLGRARNAGVRRVVVYVPGFATGIPKGTRAAHLFAGVVGSSDLLLYVDWGSAGKKLDYLGDARTAARNAPALAALLLDLHRNLPGREIDLFAHSLGTRLVALALAKVKAPADKRSVVERAVLAAPDMTVLDYTRAIARIPGPFDHVTLYVSRHDKALLLSTVINVHRRLGRLTAWQKPIARTDVVDASAARTGLDGHGYAISDPALIADIGLTLAGASVPHGDWKHAKPDAASWTYVPPPIGTPTPAVCP
jgi:esterase/lipase superfamily enzyme